jgi:murein DD-endopeptidase MepM/ murein hydrolase activator NlpD
MHPIIDKDKVQVTMGFRVPYPNTTFFQSRSLAGKPHRGVDFAPLPGYVPFKFIIVAPVDGSIIFCGRHSQYGNMIALLGNDGENSYIHFMAHLECIRKGLANGQRLAKGEIIGLMGSTGTSTAKHLHYQTEILCDEGPQTHFWTPGCWKYINPKPFLT